MIRKFAAMFAFAALLCSSQASGGWWEDPAEWDTTTETDRTSKVEISKFNDDNGQGIKMDYELLKDGHGFVVCRAEVKQRLGKKEPIVFMIKGDIPSKLEVKMIDYDGSIFWKTMDAKGKFQEWTQIAVYQDSLDYGWGGDDKFGKLQYFAIVFSGEKSKGTAYLKEMGIGKPGTPASFKAGGIILDPNWDKKGYGFDARRDQKLNPEDPGVLEWLKQAQDNGSEDKWLIPSADVGDKNVQTFNNVLCAMAFILKGERERAERILDFYANATIENNPEQFLQNLYFLGEARGFFQDAVLPSSAGGKYYSGGKSDRWMGDMVWMYFAYCHYEKEYKSDRYDKIMGLLEELLISWYTPAETGGGYLGHGWIDGDVRLHEDFGHQEGNIDAYRFMKLCNEPVLAAKIKAWLDKSIGDRAGMPLDLYTWKVMSFGKSAKKVLAYPDTDLRYLKTIEFYGKNVKGVWHSASSEINNIWVDGMGHMACAYYEAGEPEKAYFYANQMDNMLVDREINGVKCKGIPYALTEDGGFEWIRFDKGFASCAAWYIFAKNQFNPMNQKKYNYK